MRKLSNRRLWSDGLQAILPNPFTRVDLTPLSQSRPSTPGTNAPTNSTSRPTTQGNTPGK